MRIVVTNDDGIFSAGVKAMVDVLQHFGDVYVICPDRNQSAISHSITIGHPLKAVEIEHFGSGICSWMVNGTPADCIRLGMEVLLKKPPDLVFSGINIGPNLGRDIYNSGTIAGASEASLYNIPAVAVSSASFDRLHTIHPPIPSTFYQLVEEIVQNQIPSGMFLNVNLPDNETCQGVQVVPLDMNVRRYKYAEVTETLGQKSYWLKDEYQQLESRSEDKDFDKLREGYITVSPIALHNNQNRCIDQISSWFHSINNKEEFFHVKY